MNLKLQRRKSAALWILFTVLLISACSLPQVLSQVTRNLAGTAIPTQTPKVYATRTPLPTLLSTPLPRSTPIGDDYRPELFPEQDVMPYGFCVYSPLKGYVVYDEDGALRFRDLNSSITIYTLELSLADYDWSQTDMVAKSLISAYFDLEMDEVQLDEDPQVILASGFPGSLYPYTTPDSIGSYQGAVVIYALDEHLFVTAFAFVDLGAADPGIWDKKGIKDLRKLAESFLFIQNPLLESDT